MMDWPEADAEDVRFEWNYVCEVLVMYVDGQESGETWVDGAIEELADWCAQYQRGEADGWPRVTEDFTGEIIARSDPDTLAIMGEAYRAADGSYKGIAGHA